MIVSECKTVEKVFMSPNNGALVVAIPLVKIQYTITERAELSVFLHEHKALAYAVDIGENMLQFMSAEWIDKNLIYMGKL